MTSREEQRNRLIDTQEAAKSHYLSLLAKSRHATDEERVIELPHDLESIEALNNAYDAMISAEKAIEEFDATI